eukprot:366413-Chlamydomonas_euryale.AAC.16
MGSAATAAAAAAAAMGGHNVRGARSRAAVDLECHGYVRAAHRRARVRSRPPQTAPRMRPALAACAQAAKPGQRADQQALEVSGTTSRSTATRTQAPDNILPMHRCTRCIGEGAGARRCTGCIGEGAGARQCTSPMPLCSGEPGTHAQRNTDKAHAEPRRNCALRFRMRMQTSRAHLQKPGAQLPRRPDCIPVKVSDGR